ncbi:AAA family ATPase [Paraburkholderia sp. J76]|uniref:ATP-binding protein n=1 Tax=Paraburkholderia sp. J76 TaxID=2805439 RepID=UPI002ABDAEAE|nr:AAA family ATPase [Paraburkholderia sp. J76]
MKNWKISRIQIQGFKAFSHSNFEFDATTLITLEGPNGYGKTTIFDAIELLLTGKIVRLNRLFETIMQKSKTNYEDNLYWNTKNGKKTLFIKVEFEDLESGEKHAFARFADPDSLSIPANNRADKFDIFRLCKLDEFDSPDFSSEIPSNYFDEIFGKNFSKNYSLINYLHQGESSFIFGSSTADRKGVIESLIDAKDVINKIDVLSKAEKGLSTLINSKTDAAEIDRLSTVIKNLSATRETGAPIEHRGFATRTPAPDWDAKDPFPTADSQRFLELNQKIEILISASRPEVRDEIRLRRKNREIEGYVVGNDALFALVVSVGKHLDKYDDLRANSTRLELLQQISNRFGKNAKEIAVDDIDFAVSRGTNVDTALRSAIMSRDTLSSKAKELDVALAAVVNARRDLLDATEKLRREHESSCPMCGHEWNTSEQLLSAIALTGSTLNDSLDALAKQMVEVAATIDEQLGPIRIQIAEEQRKLASDFNHPLLLALENAKESFENIRKLNARLEELGIDYEADFASEAALLASRKEALIGRIRNLKGKEGDDPPLNWEPCIIEGFASFDDFYSIESTQFVEKQAYLVYTYRTRQNSALHAAKQELNAKNALKDARKNAKSRISALKSVLVETERNYSANTIADIELIFHVYSGRLIQNYQRGLGLFIERGDGKKLQFSTAEQSEHDATLSMSSGQISALSLAFFLALNRVYSKTPFVLIDDPAQSLDDINVASLTDLLRCELKDRQLLMSSHEDDIAAYMRYRFERANLGQKSFHMQSLADVRN